VDAAQSAGRINTPGLVPIFYQSAEFETGPTPMVLAIFLSSLKKTQYDHNQWNVIALFSILSKMKRNLRRSS
jgi:hypothetical protein